MNFTNNMVTIDCSDITIQFCQSLASNMDLALLMMGLGILGLLIRRKRDILIKDANKPSLLLDYLETSILPELFIIISFLFMCFVRFGR